MEDINKRNNEILERILEANIIVLDYILSKISDDDKYDEMIDLQNELMEMFVEVEGRD